MALSSNDKIKSLFSWCINITKNYPNVKISNFTSSWRNGLGFCAILHRYGPEYIDYYNLSADDVYENCQLAFQIGENHFGIPALLNAKDMATMKTPDRLSIITYLLQYYSTLSAKRPKILSIIGGPLAPIENISDDRLTEDNLMNSTAGDSLSEQPDQLICAICSEIIYFLEKLSVNDKFYHRACYRQTQLSNLKTRNRTLERPQLRSDDNVNTSNVESENSCRRSRLKSLSPVTTAKRGDSKDKSVTKCEVEGNEEADNKSEGVNNNGVRSRMRSLSPQHNAKRPPSLDGHLEKMYLENSPSKSLHQFVTDHSSPSASSVNYISINASSTDTLSKSFLGTVDDVFKKYPNKLYPSSLNTSSSSLNSSFCKKRRAPLPPAPVAVMHKQGVSKPKSMYPEDLNPFAEFEESKTNEIDTNPFAEFMTDLSDTPEKTLVKPKKRAAPKVPPMSSAEHVPIGDNPKLLETVLSLSVAEPEPEVRPSNQLTDCNQSFENDSVPVKDTNEASTEVSSSSVFTILELKNEITQTSESVQKPQPLKRTKNLQEKSKSNDSLNLAISSQSHRHKPPAPSRPAPPKREVRGDTSHEFIQYESLYSELEEVNRKQSELESDARSLQDAMNKVKEKDDGYEALLQKWLDIVEKKNAIYSKEHHLHEVLRRQELEDRHSDLEYELRVLMGKQESLKTATEKAREEELINQILDTVNARALLVEEDGEIW